MPMGLQKGEVGVALHSLLIASAMSADNHITIPNPILLDRSIWLTMHNGLKPPVNVINELPPRAYASNMTSLLINRAQLVFYFL